MQEWVTPAVLEQVAQICRDAGALIMPYFEAEGMDFDNKADARKSQVTEADTAAEAMILPLLRALAPHVAQSRTAPCIVSLRGVDVGWLT